MEVCIVLYCIVLYCIVLLWGVHQLMRLRAEIVDRMKQKRVSDRLHSDGLARNRVTQQSSHRFLSHRLVLIFFDVGVIELHLE